MLEPTLDDAGARSLLADIETIWLDRGYDSEVTRQRLAERLLDDAIIAKKRKRGEAKGKNPQPMGMRWPVERTNAWLAAYGQLRRNTDRKPIHRLAQFALGGRLHAHSQAHRLQEPLVTHVGAYSLSL